MIQVLLQLVLWRLFGCVLLEITTTVPPCPKSIELDVLAM